MWKALSKQEKDKYKEGLTPLPSSGRGGTHAWIRTSTLTEATSTADDALVNIAPARPASHPGRARRPKIRSGRIHQPLPEAPAPPTTLSTTPSDVPTMPPVASSALGTLAHTAQSSPPVVSSSSCAGHSTPSNWLARAAVPARNPAGFLWAVLVDWKGGQGTTKQHAGAASSSASATCSTFSQQSSAGSGPPSASVTSSPTFSQHSDSSDESEGITTPVPPPPRAAPSAAPSAAPAAVLPPLPTDLAQMFGDPPLPTDLAQMFGAREPPELGAPLAAPLDAPADSSSSFLERQQLAEALDEQMSGLEAVEVSK